MRLALLLPLLLALASPAPASAEPPVRPVEWSSASDFQARFEKERDNRYYPRTVQGRMLPDGTVQFRGEFHAFPPDMELFMARWGMAEPGYLQGKRELESQGFQEISHSTFTDAGGNRVHQATWLRLFRPLAMSDQLKVLHAREAARAAECERPMALLLERKYDEVDAVIRQLQQASAGGFEGERRMNCALLAFRSTDQRIIGALDEFVAARADSWVPLLLRGIHQTELGWNERGTKYAADTSDEQFAKMRRRFELARADLKQVVRRAPEVAAAQEYRIIIDKADGLGDIRRQALDQALKTSPGNLAVRQAYMVSLLPRWGGSQRAMAAFAREESKASARYPWLRVLDGMILEEQGEMACEAGECGKSLEFYERALQAYDFAPFRARRGVALANLGRDEEALEELSRALAESPGLDWARARRAYLLASHGYPAEAAEDYRKLLQIYPGDADYKAGLQHVTEHLKAVDEAQLAR